MADKTIGQLPQISQVTDSSLLPVEDTGTAYHSSGAQWKQFVRDSVAGDVAAATAAAEDAVDAAASASQDATAAERSRQAIEDMGITSQVLSPGSVPTLSRTESGGVVTLNFGLAPGPQGPAGVGLQGPQGPQGPKGDTGTAVAVETTGMYYFNVDNDSSSPTFGHLFLTYTGSQAPNFTINAQGHLIWTVS